MSQFGEGIVDITPADDQPVKFDQIQVIQYTAETAGGRSQPGYGLSVKQVYSVFPELVVTQLVDGSEVPVQFIENSIVSILIKRVQAMQAQIDTLVDRRKN